MTDPEQNKQRPHARGTGTNTNPKVALKKEKETQCGRVRTQNYRVTLFDGAKNDGAPSCRQRERQAVEGGQVKTGTFTLHGQEDKIKFILFFGSSFSDSNKTMKVKLSNLKAVLQVQRDKCASPSEASPQCAK